MVIYRTIAGAAQGVARTAVAIAMLVVGSAEISNGQPGPRPLTPAANAAKVVLPDIRPIVEFAPTIIESWSPEHPCTPHSHTHTATVKAKRLHSASFPAPAAMLYRDGQVIASWSLASSGGTEELVTLGSFTWTKDHPCPDGNTTVTFYNKNYRFVVDPDNRQAEASESNNVFEFYIDPAVPFVKAQ